ncbi:hypothetical protein SLAV_25065 [Streptomyces lavendulae subsp. lavendulae]|uniref:Uncharacterized protein n=1 Tax=Streptomyces lavendulae subsp. lavendulae TaxID=58340 RepID=A0A2K8PL45_STRLA|nr:hypothetical protein SLAV_25065 [Streptomyces lavendulae subsp. lavendulae]QUQ56637.1 hypothetical protein SLLC_23195 [Streptomyces lavendulae subsp. lavendulae]
MPPPGRRGTVRAVEREAPLVREVLPALTAELVRLLEEEGERDLAVCAHDLRLVAVCGCGDDFCQSIRTGTHVPGTPYGPGVRSVHLLPERGMLNLDVLHGRIEYVEVLDRPEYRLPDPSPSPRDGAEGEHA